VRKVSPAIGGIINTIAGTGAMGFFGDGGPATSAIFQSLYGITLDRAGNLYIADAGNNRIRKISPAGIISTVAGNGSTGYSGDGIPATATALWGPDDVAIDGAGNIYIADNANTRIRKVDASGIISTIAGNGTPGYGGDGIAATASEINDVRGIAVDDCGNLYMADENNNRVRKVDIAGIITTVAGNGVAAFTGDGGPATAASLNSPFDVKVDANGNIFIADYNNVRIRKVSSPNHAPRFMGGHGYSFTICADSTISLDSLLAVIDSDTGQGETWGIWSAPLHGTLAAGYTAISTGAKLIPSGIAYTTSGGYVGNDSFKVIVSPYAANI
jgi:hypothetical protein